MKTTQFLSFILALGLSPFVCRAHIGSYENLYDMLDTDTGQRYSAFNFGDPSPPFTTNLSGPGQFQLDAPGGILLMGNTIMVTKSNATGAVIITNDPVNGINSTTNVSLEFTGVGPANLASIILNGPLGPYADLTEFTTHDNALGRPIDSELLIENANHIALNYNKGGTSPAAHLQIGGLNQGGYAYFNTASNPASAMASPSEALYFRGVLASNSTTREVDGAMFERAGATNSTQFDFDLAYDSGTFGGVVNMPDINQAIVAIDMGINTNTSGYQGTTTINGYVNSAKTASLTVGNGNITTVGQVILGSDGRNIQAGQANQLLIGSGANGDIDFLSAGPSTANFVIEDHAGNPVFYCGPGLTGGPGIAIVKEGLAINSSHAVAAGVDLELDGSGKAVIPTNIAPVNVLSNFTFSANTIYTNLTGADVLFDLGISATAGTAAGSGLNASAFLTFNVTNNGTGRALTRIGCSNGGGSTNGNDSNVSFKLGPNDTFLGSSSTVGAQSVIGFPNNATFTADN